jgi:hypothetical protein
MVRDKYLNQLRLMTMHCRENLDAPAIAKDYWRMGSDAKLLDVMYAVRSDESTHRYGWVRSTSPSYI